MSGHRFSGWPILPLLFLIAAFVGCNLFNPSGEGGAEGDDADGLIATGEQLMRDKDFAGAYDAFSKALASDSSKSLAWHGLAKASIARDSMPITELIRRAKDLGNLKAGDSMPFLKEGDSAKNRFYRPLLRLQSILMRFQQRDSLGRTDGVYASSREANDLLIASNLGLVLKLSDLNRDTIINARDNLLKGAFDSMSSGGIKPSVISADSFLSTSGDTSGAVNTQKVADFNTFLEGMGADVETNKTILKQVTSGQTETDTASINAKIDQFLSTAGGSIVFWKINDSLDNDGDGCVDEEVWGDSLDNDGDGIIDEDARASYIIPGLPKAPGTVFARAPDDGIRNDRLNAATGLFVLGVDDADSGVFTRSTYDSLYAKGRTKAFQNNVWVDLKTDTAWTNTLKDFPNENETDQATRTKNRIRLQILAHPIDQRVSEGAKRVGGCWTKIQGGAQ